VALGLCSGLTSAQGSAQAAAALRVCADPDNLPFSNDRLEGFENKLAELIAKDMHTTVSYTWHPQRRGFIRQTLKAKRCDLVIGVPSGYDPVLTTKPYYRSSFVFVSAAARKLHLQSFDDPALHSLRIGVQAFGDDGANLPPAHALARRGITANVVGFSMLSTADSPAGKIIDAVASGEIDTAIVWGPFAGYFAQRQPVLLTLEPVSTLNDAHPLPFAFDIAMGVRPGDEAWKARLEDIQDRHRLEILAVLQAYGVPLVRDAPPTLRPSSVLTRSTPALTSQGELHEPQPESPRIDSLPRAVADGHGHPGPGPGR
jgi:quinoprotein dehydrogenase-associated probable ABC transporter substrate-binding protein